MTRTKKSSNVSILNWMGTLLLCAIPGVNLVAILCFIIFGKSPSKKSFAWALLLWTALILVAAVALLALFPNEAAELSALLRATAAK